MRHVAALAVATLLTTGCDAGKRTQAVGALEPVSSQQADSAFNAMDARHGKAVGVDPLAMAHRFETTSQGATSFSNAEFTTSLVSLRSARTSS